MNYLNVRDEHGDIKTPENYKRTLNVGKWLECGCCGSGFQVWSGYVDQDQDNGYGICKECQGDADVRNEEEWDKIIKLVADALSKENSEGFQVMDRDRQKCICSGMMDKGYIKWSIGRSDG